jgi:transposase
MKLQLLNARYVKNFVIGNKTDFNDAQAICDAVSRSNRREVAQKSIEQQDIQLLHRLRQDVVERRTALVNCQVPPDHKPLHETNAAYFFVRVEQLA